MQSRRRRRVEVGAIRHKGGWSDDLNKKMLTRQKKILFDGKKKSLISSSALPVIGRVD